MVLNYPIVGKPWPLAWCLQSRICYMCYNNCIVMLICFFVYLDNYMIPPQEASETTKHVEDDTQFVDYVSLYLAVLISVGFNTSVNLSREAL